MSRPTSEKPAEETAQASGWVVYLLECEVGKNGRNGSRRTAMYAGITNDLQARFEAHRAGKGAKYTRANPPVRILASKAYPDRPIASRAEWQLKQLPANRKLAFFAE